MNRLIIAATSLLLTTMAFADEYKAGDLTIDNPVARTTPINAPVSGGYMKITNNGAVADRLIGVTVEFAGKTEIHEMKMDGDVMKMRELEDGLEIPAGETIALMPGGFHVMFMQMNRQLQEGETYEATLSFEKAGDVTVTLNVESLGAIRESFASKDSMKEMDHSSHNSENGDMKMEEKAE